LRTITGGDEKTGHSGPRYHAYLIRLWRDGPGGAWRASLAHVASGETQRFGSPQLLWAYLQAQLEAESDASGEHDAGNR
jgi:hypothetical protein